MKKKTFLFLSIIFFLLNSCSSSTGTRASRIIQAETEEVSQRPWILLDYKERGRETPFPSWIDAFLQGEEALIESLDEFQDKYVFVAVKSGNNFNAQRQWQDSFLAELDFPRLAAKRIDRRLLAPLSGYPDDEYGAFYEMLIRAASDFLWSGAVREDDYWIQKRFTDLLPDDTEYQNGSLFYETWDFLILVTIEKALMIPQINDLLSSIKPSPSLTREQNTAVNRLKDRFFDGF